MTKTFGEIGPSLHRAGWDVIPVKSRSKKPILEGWQRGITEEQADKYAANGYKHGNVGLLAKDFPGVDIDVSDEVCAQAIQYAVELYFGTAPVRFGMAPKRLLMYRTDEPFTKVKVFLTAPDGSTKGVDGKEYAVEFLGDGQQYVIYGEHPDGFAYRWPDNDGPTNCDVWDLPTLTLAQVTEFLEQLEQWLPQGWTVQGKHIHSAGDLVGRDVNALGQLKMPLEEWDEERVDAEILPYLTGYDEYESWMRVGMALHHQFVGSMEGLVLWDNWSAQSGKYKDGECESKWSTFNGQRASGHGPATLASLIKLARQTRENRPMEAAHDVSGHPLLKFTPINGPLEAPAFVIPGAIIEGVVTIAGSPGVGKTTAMVPLALTAAGIHAEGDPLAPKHWRHVVYVSEDVNQAKRILLGATRYSGIDAAPEVVAERFHLVAAQRMPVEELVRVGIPYRERFTRIVDSVEIPPLIIIDTKSAVIATEEENSNSEASKAVALLKQQFAGLPVWIIGHVAKTNAGRTDGQALSMRGGGAIEGDANQTAFLINEDGDRFFVLGKIRFEARWSELQIETHTAETVARNQWGDLEPVTLRWGRVTPPAISRSMLKAQAKQAAAEAELRARVLKFVGSSADPINRTLIYQAVGGRKADVSTAVTALLLSGELIEQEIPKDERHNNNRRTRIVLGPLARSTGEGHRDH